MPAWLEYLLTADDPHLPCKPDTFMRGVAVGVGVGVVIVGVIVAYVMTLIWVAR